MIKIGMLGDIGAGKSFVAKQFGYPVFNADEEVSKLYKESKKCYAKLKKALPDYIISFPIKKKHISKAIIDNKKNIKKIAKIIHPEVRFRMNNFIKKNKDKKVVILDIPLLIENKLNKKNDILVFIDAPQKKINKKLKKRPGFNKNILKKLRKIQLSLEIKKKKSNFIIKNNFNNKSVKKSVKSILKKILINA
ncbi:MAG: dephospho-CoA kinase [Pelagibacterales bacterium]|nr:dephospho-CoA kinase [Pelagibacterales bacterium]